MLSSYTERFPHPTFDEIPFDLPEDFSFPEGYIPVKIFWVWDDKPPYFKLLNDILRDCDVRTSVRTEELPFGGKKQLIYLFLPEEYWTVKGDERERVVAESSFIGIRFIVHYYTVIDCMEL